MSKIFMSRGAPEVVRNCLAIRIDCALPRRMKTRLALTLVLVLSSLSAVAAIAPGPPQDLNVTVNGNAVTFVWQPPSTGAAPTSYELEVSLSPGGAVMARFLLFPAATATLGGVPDGVYYVRVRAQNAEGTSDPSNEVIVPVPSGPSGCGGPPAAPTQLTANLLGNLATLQWTASGGCGAPEYVVHAGSAAGLSDLGVANVRGVTNFSASAPAGTYFVRVLALNAFGASAASNEIVLNVGGCVAAPTAPQALSGSVSGTTVSLSWNPSSSGCAPVTYTVLAGSSPGASDLAQVNAGGQTSLSSPAPAGTYYVRVTASNTVGTSLPSNSVTVTIAASPTPVPSVTEWSVTQRFASVTGPDNCWVREQRARLTGLVSADLPMRVTYSGSAITLASDYFPADYSGTVGGPEFSTTMGVPLEGGGRPCQDGTLFQQNPGVSRVSGRFSADGQVLTATEVNSYTLTSGEPVTYVWEWVATRR